MLAPMGAGRDPFLHLLRSCQMDPGLAPGSVLVARVDQHRVREGRVWWYVTKPASGAGRDPLFNRLGRRPVVPAFAGTTAVDAIRQLAFATNSAARAARP